MAHEGTPNSPRDQSDVLVVGSSKAAGQKQRSIHIDTPSLKQVLGLSLKKVAAWIVDHFIKLLSMWLPSKAYQWTK